MPALSPLRARLASFEHAYAVALRQRQSTNRYQFVVRTDDPLQPFRVTGRPPARHEQILTMLP
ncbi:hypothetical protein L6Q21_09775 [Sandaracinobacter sp. RS1-74]|uniref:hypothetical protein n=1 Tax=Sandaracinobacteroides sayramensis TaxID=2913411 RepID=UPI001EDAE750|nr:hypothetical protein [Sandaracinobacteroides sayramensis]MCG2841268.1 hypothetical protein [Sandaracinobacteroides sayramensis]